MNVGACFYCSENELGKKLIKNNNNSNKETLDFHSILKED